jgi:hypothetical protein
VDSGDRAARYRAPVIKQKITRQWSRSAFREGDSRGTVDSPLGAARLDGFGRSRREMAHYMAPQAATDKAFHRIEEILAQYPIDQA